MKCLHTPYFNGPVAAGSDLSHLDDDADALPESDSTLKLAGGLLGLWIVPNGIYVTFAVVVQVWDRGRRAQCIPWV